MALFDFLKRKKQVEKVKEENKTEKKTAKKLSKISVIKPEKADFALQKSVAKKSAVFSYDAVREPHISEKATNLAEKNQYIFKVPPNYNKKEIKKTVESVYGVDVLSVNIIKIPAKKRRLGKTEGFRKKYRKAVVKIKEGQKIEIL